MGAIISQNIPYSGTTLSQQSLPIGAIVPYMGTTAPSGYLACDGGVYNISLYPLLAGFIEAQFGSINYFGGDGTSTFAVPNISATVDDTASNHNHYIIKAKSDRLDKITFAEVDDSTPSNESVFSSLAVKNFAGDPGYSYVTPRWLRFNPSNKKGLIIKAGTRVTLRSGIIKVWEQDTAVSFTSLTAGTDYFVFVDNNGNVTCSISSTPANDQVKIGRFHTLCVAVGSPTMIAPASPSSGLAVGGNYLVKSYDNALDSDFYSFYNKTISAVSVGSRYDIITMPHPLSGYAAGDILPESVFCLSFHPECLVEDAMVYDKDTGIAVDVYLQSGTGFNTRSRYNATHTVSREQGNHQQDYRMVGKRLLHDFEFTSAAIGSNEKTNITGSADKTTVGGHVDTANRRMVSAIGVEEMCGYLWQWLDDFVGATQDNKWDTRDGQNGFGQEYWCPYVLRAGGCWPDAAHCGSRCRYSNGLRSAVAAYISGRGSSRVNRG